MTLPEELKQNIFKVIEEQLPIKVFEHWLYGSVELSERMGEALILDLFSFNYNQRRARYEFKKALLKYFDEDEFLLWKVKANLQDLVDERETRDRILDDFYSLGLNDDKCEFLLHMGYYKHDIDNIGYNGLDLKSVIQNLKDDAASLLRDIKRAEDATPNFKLSDFDRHKPKEETLQTEPVPKQWWKFWR
ncbi:hypothetical protein [Chryseolinea lacunae]|uniref:Uncharacterized protein n=1 Tax=Chryseolinea lacunae TaxID=2801331 RepID=A0ABS1KPM6_9BACT|nr:hypothetical protein [Chryseolinea lacunae]MBL0741423.1 hypothetical protein [Chryseolinea lacunae]